MNFPDIVVPQCKSLPYEIIREKDSVHICIMNGNPHALC